MVRFHLLLASFLLCVTNVWGLSDTSNIFPAAVRTVPTCEVALARCLRRIDRNITTACRTLPTPPEAVLPVVEPGTFMLTEVRTGAFVYNDGGLLSLIILSRRRLILIDFPDSPNSNTETGSGTRLTDAIDQVLGTTVPFRIDMIYSHAHLDHIGGALRVFNFLSKKFSDARIEVFGTRETQELVEEHMTDRITPVTRRVGRKGRTLRIDDGLTIDMMIIGGHTQADLAILIPRTDGEPGILHLVDIVFPGYSMPFNLAITQNIRSLMETHREVMKLEFDVLVPGHLQTGTITDVERNLEYIEDLIETIQMVPSMIAPEQFAEAGIGNVMDPNAREFGNAFFGFIVVNDLNVDACFRIMIEKWGCRLAALDLFLRGHCNVAFLFVLTSV